MKVVGLYLVLVGAPLAGLMGVLSVGGGLEAPRAVGGVWRFEVVRVGAPHADSLERLLPAEQPTLKLVQSGARVEVQAAHEHATGVLHGSALEVRAADGSWKLEAELGPGSEAALVGTLSLAGVPLAVHAERMKPKPSAEGGH